MQNPAKASSHYFTAIITWVIASFFAFFQFLLQTAAGVMGAEWMRDFHLDKVGLSNLSAAFFYTYALVQIPAGILLDRYPPRYILALAALILTLGCFLLAYTEQYYVALMARLLMGTGSAFGFVGLLQVTAICFPPKRFAMMIGLSEGLAMLGVTFGISLLMWLVTHGSWRVTIFASGVITFFLMIAVLIFVKGFQDPSSDAGKHALSTRAIFLRLKLILTDKQVILGSLFGFFIFSIFNVFTSLWGISFLTNTYSIDRQTATNMMAFVFIGIAIGGPLSGWLSKILNQNRIILLMGAFFATLIMSIIVFVPHVPALMLSLLFLLIGLFCSVYVQCFAVIKGSVHQSIRATALAATNMIIMLGAPILQLLIGGLLESHFFGQTEDIAMIYRLSLGVLPVGMLMAFILAFYIKEPHS